MLCNHRDDHLPPLTYGSPAQLVTLRERRVHSERTHPGLSPYPVHQIPIHGFRYVLREPIWIPIGVHQLRHVGSTIPRPQKFICKVVGDKPTDTVQVRSNASRVVSKDAFEEPLEELIQ